MNRGRKDLRSAWRFFSAMPENVARWMRVSGAMRARDWAAAESHLEACFAGLDFPIPSLDAIPKMNLAAISISYWMNRPERALQSLEVAIQQLENGRIKNLAEASYVAHYCFEMAEFLAGRFPMHEPKFFQQAARVRVLAVPLNARRVRQDFRDLFPLTSLPI